MKKSAAILIIGMLCSCSYAQNRKPANSKTTTQVDSISAPPRMDGNTGHYDTVKHPTKKPDNSPGKGTEYQYNRHKDTISAKPKR